MGIEIDFLAVGEGESSGDAIAVRYGNLFGTREQQTVLVIDGGTKDSGERLVQHVKQHYGTTHVNYMFSTHPDTDHVSGLIPVFEGLSVGALVMHQPWDHAEAICHLFDDGRVTPNGIEGRFQRALWAAHDLKEMAAAKKIPIVEPFAGLADANGVLRVLGPTQDYYRLLLAGFRCAPDPISALKAFLSASVGLVKEAVSRVAESLAIETLTDDGITSSENNSSAILYIQVPGRKVLLTGDAGIPALTGAADWAASAGIDLASLDFMQVPHHGSRRNVGPAILDRIKAKTAFISAGADGGPKHPAKKVTNAILRRGGEIFATAGRGLCHSYQAPQRSGWGPVSGIPFFDQVEA
jgi:beta-lactamase superfamily II metal-dependent hydrolase